MANPYILWFCLGWVKQFWPGLCWWVGLDFATPITVDVDYPFDQSFISIRWQSNLLCCIELDVSEKQEREHAVIDVGHLAMIFDGWIDLQEMIDIYRNKLTSKTRWHEVSHRNNKNIIQQREREVHTTRGWVSGRDDGLLQSSARVSSSKSFSRRKGKGLSFIWATCNI